MRLLYQHIARIIPKKICLLLINSLREGVAIDFRHIPNQTKGRTLPADIIYKFITTSRPVEKWLLNLDANLSKMGYEKVPVEICVVIGGYGAGKSHLKGYLRRSKISNLEFLELSIRSLFSARTNDALVVNDAFALTLLRTKDNLTALYKSISVQETAKQPQQVLEEYSIDSEFAEIFCEYGESNEDNHGDFESLEREIIKKSSQIYLPIMKLYKKYLDINGICMFVDEFEELKLLDSEQQGKFIESIRALYDVLATAILDPDLPSFKLIILCTLSFWDEIKNDARSQALETRVHSLEIPPLVEDEILALAEKLYALYTRIGYFKQEFHPDFANLPAYLVKAAGIEKPLTPRFVISQIINIIEDPNEYMRYIYQSQ